MQMANKCPVCNKTRDDEEEFCTLHNDALRNVERQYPEWVKSFGGNLAKEEYYRELLSLHETGSAAKAVLRYVQEK